MKTGARPGKKSPGDRARVNEVQVFMGIGREAGVTPSDIVGVLANEAGVPGDEIGRIELQGRKTFVGLPREVADQVLEGFPSLQIRGKTAHDRGLWMRSVTNPASPGARRRVASTPRRDPSVPTGIVESRSRYSTPTVFQ